MPLPSEATSPTGEAPRSNAASPPGERETAFLSTLPPGRRERRLAVGVLVVSLIVFLAAAPFAKLPLHPVWAFIPAYESAVALNDLLTAALLYGQFAILRSRGLLWLASGYLFSSLMAVPHALSFPGLFSSSGLLGSGPQSTAWLYMFWHAGFPLFVIAYALRKTTLAESEHTGLAVVKSIAGVAALVWSFSLVATAGHDLLPAIMRGDHYTPLLIVVVTTVWLLGAAALVVVRQQQPRSVLDLWLLVVLTAWVFDTALSTVLNAGRFDLGFYAGRIYGLVAATLLLILLLLENNVLYARLVSAHESERRKSRELAAANKELDSFSYSVSHDLRAPLRAVSGFVKILEDEYGDRLDADGHRYVAVIRDGCLRMAKLIEDLLHVAKLGRQPLLTERVELDRLVEQIVDELRSDGAANEVEFEVGTLGTVDADPTLLKQALVNLLSNAVKFSRKTARAHVKVGCVVGAAATKTFFVKDNGAGFDMRHASKLFGVFQRLHGKEYDGTGVGLAIVHRVIERHGGRIWAEAEPGAGAAFYFTLQDPVGGSSPAGAK